MSTDQFSSIAFQQEIGQPTYAELIYTEVREGKAFPPSTSTVENSLNRLAFGKPGPYREVPAQTPPKLVARPANKLRYNIGASASVAPQELRAQRIADSFRRLMVNPSAAAVNQTLNKQSDKIVPLDGPSCNLVENGEFSAGLDGWFGIPGSGYAWETNPTFRLLLANGTVYYPLTGLTPGDALTISFNWYFGIISPPPTMPDGSPPDPVPPDASWLARIEVRSDTLDGPVIGLSEQVGVQNGEYSASFNTSALPSSGIVYLMFTVERYSVPYLFPEPGGIVEFSSHVQFDNVVACYLGAVDDGCDNPITNINTFIEWDGIPRKPVNVFNAFARCVFRNPNDPLDHTTTHIIPFSDGRNGTASPVACSGDANCDFWKQEGLSGNPTGHITSQDLTQSNVATVVEGQIASVAAKTNWLWSIPGSRTSNAQDLLVTLYGDGEPGILESIEFLLLINSITIQQPTAYEKVEWLNIQPQPPFPAIPVMTTTTLAAPPTAAPSGSPNIATYETGTGNLLPRLAPGQEPFYFSTVDTLDYPSAPTVPGQPGYYYIGGIVLQYDIPPTVQPPYDAFAFDLFARYYPSSNDNNTVLISLAVCPDDINGTCIGVAVPVPTQVDVGHEDLNKYEAAGYPFSPPAISASTFYVRLAVVVYMYNVTDTVPVIDITPPVLFIKGVTSGSGSGEVCAGPFLCGPDPAETFDFIVRYINSQGQAREFRKTFNASGIYPNTAAPQVPPWDTQSALGNGVRGTLARWESAKFILDTAGGTGLDQCTQPVSFEITGQGSLNFNKPTLNGRALMSIPCDASIKITEVVQGEAIFDTQSITLPLPTSGTWTITLTYKGETQTTDVIQWDASAADVRDALVSLPMVGSNSNIKVRGNGRDINPYILEFTGRFACSPVPLVEVDTTQLIGGATALVVKIVNGTKDERQVILKEVGVNDNLFMKFEDWTSEEIPYNASLNQMEFMLGNMHSIGIGNVRVRGNIEDRDSPFEGPWHVDFINVLGNRDLQPMEPQTAGYTVSTRWQGVTGVNDRQEILIRAKGGVFYIVLYTPGGGDDITGPIPYDADADTVKAAMSAAASWLADPNDFTVEKRPPNPDDDREHEWEIEFVGQWAATSIPTMDADGRALGGARPIIAKTVVGSGTSEQQKVQVLKSLGGDYQLGVVRGAGIQYTDFISWNSNALTVQAALSDLAMMSEDDDVAVADLPLSSSDARAEYMVTFSCRFGNVPLMVSVESLICGDDGGGGGGGGGGGPSGPPPLPPPYDYPLAECDASESLFCSPGPLLCRPGEGDPEVEEEACCDSLTIRDSANVYREIMLQRDLFDPNAKTASGGVLTVKDMAVLKGLRSAAYTAYTRDFYTGALRAIPITTPVTTKMSVVLIETALDTKTTRDRISRQLMSRPNILPSRMSWSNPALQG